MSKRPVPLLSLLAAMAGSAHAADIDEIIVTAGRMERPETAIPNTVTLIDNEALTLQTTLVNDLSGVLGNLVPSFSPARQKMSGFGETLRGRAPLYMIDGVPQSNPLRDGSRDGHTIALDFVERVEVINGSNAIQGLGAAGGIINLVTPSAPDDGSWLHRFRLGTTFSDEFDDDALGWRGSYLGGKRFGDVDVVAGVSYESRGIFIDGAGDPVGIDNTQGDLADSGARNFFLKAGWEPLPDQRLQLMLNDFQLEGDGDWLQVPGNRAAGIPTTSVKGAPPGVPATNDVTTLSLDYTHSALFGGKLSLQGFYQDFEAVFGGGVFGIFQDPAIDPTGTLFEQSSNQSEKIGMRATYLHRDLPLAGFGIAFGVDYLEDETVQALVNTEREWVPTTRFVNIAPFVQLEQALFSERVFITAGLRHEDARLDTGDFTTIASAGNTFVAGGEPDFNETLFNAGGIFNATEDLSLYVSYSEGFTMPDVGRVLRAVSTPGLSVDDILDLQPVVSDTTEIGADFNNGSLRLHAGYYWSNSDLGLRLQNVGGIFEVQRERTEIEGLELSGEYAHASGWGAGLLYSQIDGRFDSNGDDDVDTDLDGVNVSPDRLNGFVTWQGPAPFARSIARGVNARLQVSQFFSRDFDGPAAPVGQDFGGYTLVDLFVGVDTQLGNFSLGIENLADNQFITWFGQTAGTRDDQFFAGRGRTLTLLWRHQL